MKFELFEKNDIQLQKSASMVPPKLYKQECDWTCCIACIRSILSAFGDTQTEDGIIQKYNLTPQSYFSKDIKKLNIFTNYNVTYGCDKPVTVFEELMEYLYNKHYVMVESMINVSHWLVLLGCFKLSQNDTNVDSLLLFDPYYNKISLYSIDEFVNMWRDFNYLQNNIINDYIAVKSKESR